MADGRSRDSGVVVVSGAAGDIGRTIRSAFAEQGHRVVGVDRVFPVGDQPLAGYLRADFADFDSLEPLLDYGVVAEFGAISVLVNNDAHLDQMPFAGLTPDSIMRTLTVNVAAMALLTRAAAARMVAGAGRVILDIASIRDKRSSSQPIYGASKAGFVSLTRTLAGLYALSVRVAGVAPVLIGAGTGPALSPEAREASLARTPLGHGATADEVARAAAFLASPAASYVTGETVDEHGGL